MAKGTTSIEQKPHKPTEEQSPLINRTATFLAKLINEMLDPRLEERPSPEKVLQRFSAGYFAFLSEHSKK